MYNEEIKNLFLDSINQSTGVSCRKALSRIVDSEKKFGKDVCQMTRAEAIKTVQSSTTYEPGTITVLISCLKAYARWAYDNGYYKESPYGILGVSSADIRPESAMRDYIIETEQELIDALRSVVSLHEGNTEVVACILAWIGVPNVLEIHDSDVLLNQRKILCGGKVIVDGFSDFVYDFLTEYVGMKSAKRENASTAYDVYKDYSYDTFVKRFCTLSSSKRGTPLELKTVQTAINKMNVKYEQNGGTPKLSYKNILRSGSLRRLYEAECHGLDVFSKENEKVVEGYFYKTSYRTIIILYRNYKTAFNL